MVVFMEAKNMTIKINPATYHFGDTVHLDTRRAKGDCVIAETRRISRGRSAGKVEYTLASLAPGGFPGNAYAWRIRGTEHFSAAKGSYTKAQTEAAIERLYETKGAVKERKQARADRGREALGTPDYKSTRASGLAATDRLAPGDLVVIAYRGGTRRTEEVVRINWQTGKVAIKANNRSGVRWIPATQVVEVRSVQRALPIKITDAVYANLVAKGWAQIRIGSEFIEQSYVVAFDRATARTAGTDYECASIEVFQDSALGVYWRRTGSFD